MAFRAIQLSYQAIRRWCDQFGAESAAQLKRKRPKLGDKWHLDEVFLKINGVQPYLWRAVDQPGAVIDILVQPKRDRHAAIRCFRKLRQTTRRQPRVIVTDKLRSPGAARKALLPRVRHRQSRYLNNRAENSPQPTQQREPRMKRFQSPEQAQRFLEKHDILSAHFRPKRQVLPAIQYRAERDRRLQVGRPITIAGNLRGATLSTPNFHPLPS